MTTCGFEVTLCVLQNNSVRIEIGGGGVVGTTAVNDGLWHHVAAVYDPTATNKYLLYIDGLFETSGNISTVINTSSVTNFRIGKRVDGVNHFDGAIDEVRVYDYVRTATEIANEYNSEYCTVPSGLKAYYRLNDGIVNGNNTTIATVTDDSGNNNSGTLHNFTLTGSASNWVTGPVITAGANGSSYTVNSCNDYTSPSGNTYSTSGTYSEIYTNNAGCDSIVTIDLTITLPTSHITVNTCDSYTSPSGNYTWTGSGYYQDTLQTSAGCDSVINISLTIENYNGSQSISACEAYTTPDGNNTWTSSGQYQVTYTNMAGCDSVVNYNITINDPTTSTINIVACGTYTSPSGSNIWTSSGIYTDIIPNANGCDSTITINLTIDTVETTITQNGAVLTANLSGASYQWYSCEIGDSTALMLISGATGQSYTVASSGGYAVEVTQNNCTEISQCLYVDISGMNESVEYGIKLFPNPAVGDYFMIDLNVLYPFIKVQVFSTYGELIFSEHYSNVSQIPIIKNWPGSIYFIKVEAENKSWILQLIKI